MKRAGLALLGIPLMAIGLIGWIMPVIPGAPIFFLGLAMTISWHPKGRALVEKWQLSLKKLAGRFGLHRRSKEEINADLFRVEPSAPTPLPDKR